jgi:hypothetical protein
MPLGATMSAPHSACETATFAKHFQGRVVEHIALRQSRLKMLAGIQNPAVTVIGVFTQADIRHHHHLRKLILDGADRLLDNAILGEILQPNVRESQTG